MLLPDWIKAETKLNKKPFFSRSTTGVHSTKSLLRHHRLLSVCEEARCPNKEFCFAKPTATFMILGAVCTRKCAFCAVGSDPLSALIPADVDPDEPDQIAGAAREMGLKYMSLPR